jgi:hypothetical protein
MATLKTNHAHLFPPRSLRHQVDDIPDPDFKEGAVGGVVFNESGDGPWDVLRALDTQHDNNLILGPREEVRDTHEMIVGQCHLALLNVGCKHVFNLLPCTPRRLEPLNGTRVRDHPNVVLRHAEVTLDAVGPEGVCPLEGRERIVRILRSPGATMAYNEGPIASNICPARAHGGSPWRRSLRSDQTKENDNGCKQQPRHFQLQLE